MSEAIPVRCWGSAADTVVEHATEAEARQHEQSGTTTVYRDGDGPWMDADTGEVCDLFDAQMVAKWHAEDREARERLAAQQARADLTPLETGRWTIEVTWRADLIGGSGVPSVTQRHEPDFEAARRGGAQASCWAGTRKVRVAGPDGRIHFTYDRQGNYWLRHTPEAEAAYR